VLLLLHIENIAVIQSADIVFEPGMNVLTGETGAGKSIVVDSIGAILGARMSRDAVRTGSKRAHVSAVFGALPAAVTAELAQYGIEPDEDGRVIVERDLAEDGRSTCRVNARPVTVTLLRDIGNLLVNIHGQHDSQQLLNESCHLVYLDRFGETAALLEDYQRHYRALTETEKEIRALSVDESEQARQMDMLRYQIAQLEKAELKENEDLELEARRKVLMNAEKLSGAVNRAVGLLYGDDDTSGAVGMAGDAIRELERCADDSAELSQALDLLAQAQDALDDAARKVLDVSFTLEYDEQEVDAIESRLDKISRLKRRYGNSVAEMLQFLDRCRTQLDGMSSSSDRLEQLQRVREQQYAAAQAAAEKLTAARRNDAEQLSRQVSGELADLDMRGAKFCAELSDTGKLTPTGRDQVAFLISVNAGETPKPLAKVASGGELSRVMLALKNILAASDDVSTLVFDEVDTGVSGRAAQKVARKLADVSAVKQVLCVTHLPQLACMADHHLLIRKEEQQGRTFTSVVPLDAQGRAGELARIMTGETITETALAGAREQLEEAAAYKKNRKKR